MSVMLLVYYRKMFVFLTHKYFMNFLSILKIEDARSDINIKTKRKKKQCAKIANTFS